MTVKFEKLDKALCQLEVALSLKEPSDLERDGAIQRFEYTIELLWKTAKKTLEENGVSALTPKDVIREMASVGWIENPKDFLNYLKMRNETSHTYAEKKAKEVFEKSKVFAKDCSKLITVLKEKSE